VADADGMPAPRKVKIGINNGANAEVLSGLAEGDKVIVGEGGGLQGTGGGNRGGSTVRIGGSGMGGPRR